MGLIKILAVIAAFFVVGESYGDVLERKPGESYVEYAERYENFLEQQAKLNQLETAAKPQSKSAFSRPSARLLPSVDSERRNIVDRCRESVGQHGASMVKACADRDIEAISALATYPAQHASIIQRCLDSVGKYGYSMVKACSDRDIEAESALSAY